MSVRLRDEGEAVSTPPRRACVVRVVPTDEDLMIARHTRAVLARLGGRPPGWKENG